MSGRCRKTSSPMLRKETKIFEEINGLGFFGIYFQRDYFWEFFFFMVVWDTVQVRSFVVVFLVSGEPWGVKNCEL